ncbi:hypothetical protein OQA88_1558 [Cercophora sp. LCS_1]
MTTPYKNPVLIIGGTGTVGSRIAKQLAARSITALVASRQGTGSDNAVMFDWHEPNTWSAPFDKSKSSSDKPSSEKPASDKDTKDSKDSKDSNFVRSVYLIAPPTLDSASVMMEFVDFARQHGARRFVLQSASAIESGGPAMGRVHAYLRELGQRGEVEWCVLRPTWFQQNLAEQESHVRSIRDESKLYSATGDGKIPWVSADDIAAVAANVLTRIDAPNTELLVLGPELLSYNEIATMLSEILKRKIVHVDLSTAGLAQYHKSHGMPESYAHMLSNIDTCIKFGSENRTNDVVFSVTGSNPRRFRDYMESVKSVWNPVPSKA